MQSRQLAASYLKRRGGEEDFPTEEFDGILELIVEASATTLAQKEFDNADCQGQTFLSEHRLADSLAIKGRKVQAGSERPGVG